eukprot:m.19503 g.19503  ORF g.19503 m.19503 type:complete len:654 (-) comp5938_c0_seq2:560-2521(-)
MAAACSAVCGGLLVAPALRSVRALPQVVVPRYRVAMASGGEGGGQRAWWGARSTDSRRIHSSVCSTANRRKKARKLDAVTATAGHADRGRNNTDHIGRKGSECSSSGVTQSSDGEHAVVDARVDRGSRSRSEAAQTSFVQDSSHQNQQSLSETDNADLRSAYTDDEELSPAELHAEVQRRAKRKKAFVNNKVVVVGVVYVCVCVFVGRVGGNTETNGGNQTFVRRNSLKAMAAPAVRAAMMLLLLVACLHGGHAIGTEGLQNSSFLAHLKPSATDVGAKKPFVKHDTLVPMRDGVTLNTITFVPLHVNPKHTYAAVLIRTPYGATGLKDEGQMYVDQGFAVVMQDFRGRFASQGTFRCWWNASTDGLDTIEWVRSQSWSSGVVFSTGTSANGIAAYLEMVAAPSPQQLAAQFVTVGTPTLHSMMYQGGAFRESLIVGWLAGINESSAVVNVTAHEPLSSYWDNVSMAHPAKWDNIKIPAVHLTGWYDIFVEWTIDAYDAYRRQNESNFLIVLPSGHCPGGQIDWPDAGDGTATAAALAVEMFKALSQNRGDGVAAAQALKDTPHVQCLSIRRRLHPLGHHPLLTTLLTQFQPWAATTFCCQSVVRGTSRCCTTEATFSRLLQSHCSRIWLLREASAQSFSCLHLLSTLILPQS